MQSEVLMSVDPAGSKVCHSSLYFRFAEALQSEMGAGPELTNLERVVTGEGVQEPPEGNKGGEEDSEEQDKSDTV